MTDQSSTLFASQFQSQQTTVVKLQVKSLLSVHSTSSVVDLSSSQSNMGNGQELLSFQLDND